MRTCAHTYMCTHSCVHMYTWSHEHTSLHACTHMHMRTHTPMHADMHTQTSHHTTPHHTTPHHTIHRTTYSVRTNAPHHLILTNCGKYTYIYLSFYFLLKQDKLGSCIIYLLCVYESYSVCGRQLLLYFFIYCIDFPYFQDNAG